MPRRQTTEEKVAKKITDLLSDLRLDIEKVGFYIARQYPTVCYNRLVVLTDSAEEEMEGKNVRHYDYI